MDSTGSSDPRPASPGVGEKGHGDPQRDGGKMRSGRHSPSLPTFRARRPGLDRKWSSSSSNTTPFNLRAISRLPRGSLPAAVRLALVSLLLVVCILRMSHNHSSPWDATYRPLFLRRPPKLVRLDHIPDSPPTLRSLRHGEGCRDLRVTTREKREKGAILMMVGERDMDNVVATILNFEARFNAAFRYPYVFLSSPTTGSLPVSFHDAVTDVLPFGAAVEWGSIGVEHWIRPSVVAEEATTLPEVERRRKERWWSSGWEMHSLMDKYDWSWRLEPGAAFMSDITYDPFRLLADGGKRYGYIATTSQPPLPSNALPILQAYFGPRAAVPLAALPQFLVEDRPGGACRIENSFEIADLRFFRRPEYKRRFDQLDAYGAFGNRQVSTPRPFPQRPVSDAALDNGCQTLMYELRSWQKSSVSTKYIDSKTLHICSERQHTVRYWDVTCRVEHQRRVQGVKEHGRML